MIDTELILNRMKERKITQTELARVLGCQKCTVNLKLHGKSQLTDEELRVILKLVGIDLVGMTDDGKYLQLFNEEE